MKNGEETGHSFITLLKQHFPVIFIKMHKIPVVAQNRGEGSVTQTSLESVDICISFIIENECKCTLRIQRISKHQDVESSLL